MARNTALGTVIVATSLLAYLYITDVRSSILHRWLLVPVLRNIHEDGEAAHDAATRALSLAYPFGLHPRERFDTDEVGDLEIEVLGHRLCNPIGTSAGIDKGAEVPDQLLALGSAYVEVGGITPLPQEGNPKPRLFRLISQSALINRFGLNSDGADRVAMRLRKRLRRYAYSIGFGLDEEAEARVLNGEAGVPPGSLVKGKLLAVQIAKNKMTPDDDIEAITNDYVCCVERLGKFADVIVVNVSSPNTENLRDLQRQEPLERILSGVVDATRKINRKTIPKVMVKVSPDEDSEIHILEICTAVRRSEVGGVIVANTTRRRPYPSDKEPQLSQEDYATMEEQGGYSGPKLFERTVKLVARYRQELDRDMDASQDLLAGLEAPRAPVAGGSSTSNATEPAIMNPNEQSPILKSTVSFSARKPGKKAIFCSGGVTNGKQALEALHAGADMVQVYTALIYGGAGTISRLKDELRSEMKKGGNQK